MGRNVKYSKSIKITLCAGIISVFSLLFMILALLDIYQGKEPDFSNEWIVVTIGIIVNMVLSMLVIFTTIRIMTIKEKS